MARLERGNFVRVRLADTSDEWAGAFVGLASESDPSSVMLVLSHGAGVRTRQGGFIFNALPLTINYAKETVESLFGDSYEIEVTR